MSVPPDQSEAYAWLPDDWITTAAHRKIGRTQGTEHSQRCTDESVFSPRTDQEAAFAPYFTNCFQASCFSHQLEHDNSTLASFILLAVVSSRPPNQNPPANRLPVLAVTLSTNTLGAD